MLRYRDMKPYSKDAWKEGYTPKSWSEHQSFIFWAKIIGIIYSHRIASLFPIHVSFADTRYRFRPIHLSPTTAPVR